MRSRRRIPTYSTFCSQVLDDGRLTDGQGRTVDFRNTLIVLTSILGCEAFAPMPAGAGGCLGGVTRDAVMEAVRDPPSGRNSATGSTRSCCSGGCRRDDMAGIVDDPARKRLMRNCSPTGRSTLRGRRLRRGAWLASTGYDPVYGARPLKRVIQRELQNPLAQLILEGRIPDGSTPSTVGAGDEWPGDRRDRDGGSGLAEHPAHLSFSPPPAGERRGGSFPASAAYAASNSAGEAVAGSSSRPSRYCRTTCHSRVSNMSSAPM